MDTVAGTARLIRPVLDYPTDQSAIVRLSLGDSAIWTLAGGRLRLERLDGTVIREWNDAVDELPDATADGSVLLVPLHGGWHRVTAAGQQLVVSDGLGAKLSPDGRFVGYLRWTDRSSWLSVRVFDSANGTDVAVQDVHSCNCGISLTVGWDAEGRLLFRDFWDPAYRLGIAPGRSFRYEPLSGEVQEYVPVRRPPEESSILRTGALATCAGIFIEHPLVPAHASCIVGATAGAWSRDRRKVAYYLDGHVYVLEPGVTTSGAQVAPLFRPLAYYAWPPLQWDASGRYLVVATVEG
ncbi:MAG: hypothetical protein AB7G21_04705 [Dehalococcoidia bacterium]